MENTISQLRRLFLSKGHSGLTLAKEELAGINGGIGVGVIPVSLGTSFWSAFFTLNAWLMRCYKIKVSGQ